MYKFLVSLVLLCASTVFAADMNVAGTGKVSVEPDVGYITLGVISRDKESAAKALVVNTATMTAIYKSLGDLGVAKKDIQTADFTVGEDRTYENNKEAFHGYYVQNVVRVTVCDLKSFGKVLDLLVKDGANKIQQVSFGSTKYEDLTAQARMLACKNAKLKAQQMAATLGVNLGSIKLVSEVDGRAPATYERSMAAAGASGHDVPVSGGSLEFSVTVHVTFYVF